MLLGLQDITSSAFIWHLALVFGSLLSGRGVDEYIPILWLKLCSGCITVSESTGEERCPDSSLASSPDLERNGN